MANNDGKEYFRPLSAFGNWFRNMLFGASDTPAPVEPRPRAYNVRKQKLPHTFTPQDWDRALEYWDYKCAICERPRGLWHTLSQDHWIPLTHPECPGTVATNILPLCHGTDGCNNSKGKKHPREWLIAKLGTRKANKKLKEIEAYFEWAHEHTQRRLGCPCCGAPVKRDAESGLWNCPRCGAGWDDAMAQTFINCPTCECWMLDPDQGGPNTVHGTHYCPRCEVRYTDSELPGYERCPGCKRGSLRWVEEDEGYWHCPACGGEWVDDE